MSYSIVITIPTPSLDVLEKFLLHSGFQFQGCSDKPHGGDKLHYRKNGVETVVEYNEKTTTVYVTVPWRSEQWTGLWQPANDVLKKFGGTATGDGLEGRALQMPPEEEWRKRFQRENDAQRR